MALNKNGTARHGKGCHNIVFTGWRPYPRPLLLLGGFRTCLLNLNRVCLSNSPWLEAENPCTLILNFWKPLMTGELLAVLFGTWKFRVPATRMLEPDLGTSFVSCSKCSKCSMRWLLSSYHMLFQVHHSVLYGANIDNSRMQFQHKHHSCDVHQLLGWDPDSETN